MSELIELRTAVIAQDHKWVNEKKRHHALRVYDFLEGCFMGHCSPDLEPNGIRFKDYAVIEGGIANDNTLINFYSLQNRKKKVE